MGGRAYGAVEFTPESVVFISTYLAVLLAAPHNITLNADFSLRRLTFNLRNTVDTSLNYS